MSHPALLFDLDGTLIDSAPDIHAGVCHVLALEKLPGVTFEQTRSFIGRGVPALIDQVRAAVGQAPDPEQAARMVAAFEALYETAVSRTLLFDDVTSVLTSLRDQGHLLALCTNKPKAPTDAVLKHFNLTALFSALSYGDGPYARKPDPAPVHHILQTLNQPNAIYIGDSETDAATAAAAGLPFLLFTRGYRRASVDDIPHQGQFDRYSDLPGLIARLSAP